MEFSIATSFQMEGCLSNTLRSLRRLSSEEIKIVLQQESKRLEVTKSLLGLLYNICLDKSIPLSIRFKVEFKRFTPLVLRLLQGSSRDLNKTRGLAIKKRIFEANPEFVKILTEACPVSRVQS